MKPSNLKTKVFLDSGDPKETKELLEILGFLDGQTTNPSLVAKNPEAVARLERGEKFSEEEIYTFYQGVVKEISDLIPEGSVSIEVYADAETKAETMLEQAKGFFQWIPNAHIKYPTTAEGLKAAEQSIKEGMRVNMTLVFDQEQAAAVYTATKGAHKGDVFVSPFVGRLDDRGENGMELIQNIQKMYQNGGDGHVEVLVASVRNMDHLMESIRIGADIITAPFKLWKEWAEKGMPVEITNFKYQIPNAKPITYSEIGLDKAWTEYNSQHDLTDSGIKKFAEDWNKLINKKP